MFITSETTAAGREHANAVLEERTGTCKSIWKKHALSSWLQKMVSFGGRGKGLRCCWAFSRTYKGSGCFLFERISLLPVGAQHDSLVYVIRSHAFEDKKEVLSHSGASV